MNYEDFYQELQPQEKSLKDGLAALQRLFKAVSKETENGDVKGLGRDLEAMAETARSFLASLDEVRDTVNGFDTKAYFESGDFAAQMLDACGEKGVDVRGEAPVYEMFPYRVRLDFENQDVYLDRKRVACMRPQVLVDTIRTGQEKLSRASFNASVFINELAGAYDLAALKLKKRPDGDIYLTSLYKFLAPMGRFRRDYDLHSFAFDLAKLYAAEERTVKDGRMLQFGPGREHKQAIRILDQYGKEQFLVTVRFYHP